MDADLKGKGFDKYSDEILDVVDDGCAVGCRVDKYGCFVGDTKVKTTQGLRDIDHLHSGDKIIAYDKINNQSTEKLIQGIKITSKKFDIELVNGPPQYYELKNKNYADMQTLPSSDADQVLSATGAFSKIDNIEDYEWTAYIRRFGENADSEEAKTILKDLWKARFENNTLQNFDVIWNNTNLRNSLLNNPSDEVQGLQRFTNLISEHGNPNIPNPKLYSFIKAE